jgi:hypothetical protein
MALDYVEQYRLLEHEYQKASADYVQFRREHNLDSNHPQRFSMLGKHQKAILGELKRQRDQIGAQRDAARIRANDIILNYSAAGLPSSDLPNRPDFLFPAPYDKAPYTDRDIIAAWKKGEPIRGIPDANEMFARKKYPQSERGRPPEELSTRFFTELNRLDPPYIPPTRSGDDSPEDFRYEPIRRGKYQPWVEDEARRTGEKLPRWSDDAMQIVPNWDALAPLTMPQARELVGKINAYEFMDLDQKAAFMGPKRPGESEPAYKARLNEAYKIDRLLHWYRGGGGKNPTLEIIGGDGNTYVVDARSLEVQGTFPGSEYPSPDNPEALKYHSRTALENLKGAFQAGWEWGTGAFPIKNRGEHGRSILTMLLPEQLDRQRDVQKLNDQLAMSNIAPRLSLRQLSDWLTQAQGPDSPRLRDILDSGLSGVGSTIGALAGDLWSHGTMKYLWRSHPGDVVQTQITPYVTKQAVDPPTYLRADINKYKPFLAVPGMIALSVGSGNVDLGNLFNTEEGPRPEGYRALRSTYENPTVTQNYPLATTMALFTGQSSYLLPWEEFRKERPEVPYEHYRDYQEYLWGNQGIELMDGLIRATDDSIAAPQDAHPLDPRQYEAQIMGFRINPIGLAASAATIGLGYQAIKRLNRNRLNRLITPLNYEIDNQPSQLEIF